MAAEVLSTAGWRVEVFDAMPSVARKFLLAGRGGLNLTHSEARDKFLARYGDRRQEVGRWLDEFGPQQLRDWARGLGVATFVGSSGRVFPQEMKAAPLLRAWLRRLRGAGVVFHARHRWRGWQEDGGALRFETPAGEVTVETAAVVLALGGGSWARLGSDGAWLPLLAARGIRVQALRPANCGFNADWSEHLRQRFAGQPVKPVGAAFRAPDGSLIKRDGEFVITSRTGPISATRPAYSTATRSQVSAITPMSCVISITAVPCWRHTRLSRVMICAWIDTSSAVVGSSATISCGSAARARAITTRWRMPPENWCG